MSDNYQYNKNGFTHLYSITNIMQGINHLMIIILNDFAIFYTIGCQISQLYINVFIFIILFIITLVINHYFLQIHVMNLSFPLKMIFFVCLLPLKYLF